MSGEQVFNQILEWCEVFPSIFTRIEDDTNFLVSVIQLGNSYKANLYWASVATGMQRIASIEDADTIHEAVLMVWKKYQGEDNV